MPSTGSTRRRRTRGEIETLPSGSLRVRVYAGIDPISGKRQYLTQVVPAAKNAAKEAEQVRTRLQSEVDDRRNPRTNATVAQLMDRYVGMLNVEETTRAGYEGLTRLHQPTARRARSGANRRRDTGLVLCGVTSVPEAL